MARFVTKKLNDGPEASAVMRGLQWLLNHTTTISYIYTPSKDVMKAIIGDIPFLKPILKSNRMMIGEKQFHLTFGHTDGALSGNKVQHGSKDPILALYANPARFAWVEARMNPDAPFCLVPHMESEIVDWVAQHHPTEI